MATLSDTIRTEISLAFQDDLSALFETLAGVTKTDVKTAVDAADQWVEDNKASYNNALPLAARNNLTASQKSKLLRFVVARRFEEGE